MNGCIVMPIEGGAGAMGLVLLSIIVGGLGFLPVLILKTPALRWGLGVLAGLAVGIALGICLLTPDRGWGALGFLVPLVILWTISGLLFLLGIGAISLQVAGGSALETNLPASGRPALVCPSCGARFTPDDYREGAESRCVKCQTLLVCDEAGAQQAHQPGAVS
jgi:hypothetical protein